MARLLLPLLLSACALTARTQVTHPITAPPSSSHPAGNYDVTSGSHPQLTVDPNAGDDVSYDPYELIDTSACQGTCTTQCGQQCQTCNTQCSDCRQCGDCDSECAYCYDDFSQVGCQDRPCIDCMKCAGCSHCASCSACSACSMATGVGWSQSGPAAPAEGNNFNVSHTVKSTSGASTGDDGTVSGHAVVLVMLAGAVVGAALAAYVVVKVRRNRAQGEDRSAEPLLADSAGGKIATAAGDSAYGTIQPDTSVTNL